MLLLQTNHRLRLFNQVLETLVYIFSEIERNENGTFLAIFS